MNSRNLPRRRLLALLVAVAAIGRPAGADQPGAVDPAIDRIVQQLGLQESATPVRELAGWQRPKKVLFLNLNPALVPSLQAVAPGVELVPARDAAEAAKLAGGVDAVLGFCTPEVLAAGPAIRWIQVYWAGVERCVAIPALTERKILLTNMQRVAGPVMAEHVLAMMLAFTRGLDFYILERAAARWTRELPPPAKLTALEGKTVLVVGLGGIGTEVARRANALGMRVTATRASGREGPPFVSYVGLPDELRKHAGDHGRFRCGFLRRREAGRVLHQRGARQERGASGSRRRAQERPHRGRRPRRYRPGAAAG
jgi:hypothetical protein